MNRILMYLNFLGILTLALLCAHQWGINNRLLNHIQDLQHQNDDQRTKIAAQETALQQDADDMKELHERITLSESQLQQTTTALKLATAERDQYRHSYDQVIAAVKQRDQMLSQQTDVLKTQAATIHKLEDERNQAVGKYNDLATKYNAMVAGQKGG